jgi:hypothetical protein
VLICLTAVCPTTVAANDIQDQTTRTQGAARSFDELRALLEPGDTVAVTDAAGRDLRGRVVALSSLLALLVDGRQLDLRESDVRIIERRGDSLKNGALRGLSVGLGLYVALFATGFAIYGPPEADDWPALIGAAVGAAAMGVGVGAGIDAMVRGWRVVYQSPSRSSTKIVVSPILDSARRGVRLAWQF